MKPTKHSLLRGNESQRPIYASDELYDEPHHFTSTHQDIPYAQFQQKPNVHPQGSHIEMKALRSMGSNIGHAQCNYQKMETQNRSRANTSQSQYQPYPPQQVRSCIPGTKFHSNIVQQPQQPNFHSVVYPGYPPMPRPMPPNRSQLTPQPPQPPQQQQQPFIPPVTVSCEFCQCKQRIPGDTDQFYCGSCQQINKTQPRFGLFVCGACRQKVSYPYRTSDHITCNNCYTINKVAPFPPNTRKSKVQLSSLNQSSMVLPRELREQEEDKKQKVQEQYTSLMQNSQIDSRFAKDAEDEQQIVERQ